MSDSPAPAAAPRLSIVTVNLNNRAGLERTLESVARQRPPATCEHIVVDGCSTDGSQDVARRHAERLAAWVSERDRGIYHAMNKGVALARGDYLLFLNSGDCLVDDAVLDRALAALPPADIVYGAILATRSGRPGRLVTAPAPERLTPSFWIGNTIQQSGSFIRRQLLLEHGFDEDFRIVADRKFFFEAFLQGRTFARIPLLVTHFAMGGISSDPAFAEMRRAELDRLFTRHMTPALLAALRAEVALRHREERALWGAHPPPVEGDSDRRETVRRWLDLFFLLYRQRPTRFMLRAFAAFVRHCERWRVSGQGKSGGNR